MKKYLVVLIAILICLSAPIHTHASQSEIETTVPTTHTVAIEAEHASALYVEGDKGLSSTYPVPRFSNPQFKITAEEGYTIKRVLLNGIDVTKKIKDGTLKLSKVSENQVIEIETEAILQETPQASQTPQTPQTSQATQNSENVEKTVQNQETGKQLPGTQSSKTVNESDGSDTEKEPEETGQTTSKDSTPWIWEEDVKHSDAWRIVLMLLSAGIVLWIILLINKRKKDQDEKKNLDL